MKKIITSILLLGAFAANAGVVNVKLPKAGSFLVKVTAPSSCSGAEFSLFSKERGMGSDGKFFLNVEMKWIKLLYGTATWCDGKDHIANGVFIVGEEMTLNIDLDFIENATVTVDEVVKTSPIQ